MKRCWVHIGMHKTGTTSLQQSLANVSKPVGWRFIEVGGRRNLGSALYAMFSSRPENYHWFQMRGDTPEQVANAGAKLRKGFAKAIGKCSEENLIISGESLTLIDAAGILALRDFLKPLCDEIKIVGYVRPPVGFKISFFQQRVKHAYAPFDFTDFKLRYKKRFQKFDHVFGAENVLLRKFDPASFQRQCVVADFCGQLGIEAPETGAVIRVNESLCREACGILYAFRKYGPESRVGKDVIKENKQILAPLFAMRGTKFTVSAALVKSSLAREASDLRWMEKRLGAPLREAIPDDGTAVASEGDLLRIERASCEEFAARFTEYHGIPIPGEMIPSGSPVDPRRVAEFVACCQGLCRQGIADRRELKRKLGPVAPPPPECRPARKTERKKHRLLRRFWRYLKRAAGGPRGS